MKKNFLCISTAIFLWNCTGKSTFPKEDFMGTWNNFPLTLHNQIQFYQDSVVFWDLCRKSVATWEVDKDSIYFQSIKEPAPFERERWSLKYQFSPTKDSIHFVLSEDDPYDYVLLKVQDNWKHYLKGLDMDLELPVAGSLSSHTPQPNNALTDIYIGWKDQKPSVRVEYTFKEIKNQGDFFSALLRSLNQSKYDTIYPFYLIVDKNIPEPVVDSIKGEVRSLFSKNVHFFKVWEQEAIETQYGKINPDCINDAYDWNWYGRWIEE
jgi:hypothetical protein